MEIARFPTNETARLETLNGYGILDTPAEEAFDELTALASSICGTPISLISLVDSHRQWFKSKVGLSAAETSRDIAFCAHAILQEEVFVVEDALEDSRFSDNPLVHSDPNIRFYAGMPLQAGGGAMLGTLCVIDRIPRSLTAEQLQALRVLGKQVINQIELRSSVQQLQELNATKDKFFSIISHDLRTPFSGIIGLTELLQDDLEEQSPEETREMLGDIHGAAEAGINLVRNLLEWALCETGKMKFDPQNLHPYALVEKVIALLTGAINNKALTCTLTGPADLECYADRNMLYCVLENLISNAVKFTASGGQIGIRLEKINSTVEIEVTDSGVGMTAEKLEQLFQVGETVSTSGTEGESGTGLGLLLCKQFVEKNGGEMMVYSEEYKGTSFRFTLPLARP